MEVAVEVKTISSSVAPEKSIAKLKRKPAIEEPTNPYLAARREWDERYGSLITRARNWRLIAILCASAALMQTAGLIALSLRAKVVPYVVAVDALGHQVAAGP